MPVGGISTFARFLYEYGNQEQKDRWLRALVRGDLELGFAITEPSGGSDVVSMQTRAERKGDVYVLEGEKGPVGGVRWSDAFVVFAKTSPEKGARGVSAFIVDANTPGIDKYYFNAIGRKHYGLGGYRFRGVEIPVENRIGEEGKGIYMLFGFFDWARALYGLECAACGLGALDELIDFVKNRKTFGQPLGKWESIQFRISEHYTRLEMARWYCYRTLWMKDRGLPISKESAMCKWFSSEAALAAANDCLQMKGAVAYTDECLDEYRIRTLRGSTIGEGTTEMMKIVIGRELLGKEFVPYR